MNRRQKQKLVESHLPIARRLARKFAKRCEGLSMEYDDVLSYATIGLIRAANKYDPKRGTKFMTCAYPRIVGAILDGMRAESRGWQRNLGHVEVVEFKEWQHSSDEAPDMTRRMQHVKLREELDKMDALDRHLLMMSTYRGGIQDVATEMGISKSWASRLKQLAMEILTHRMAEPA